MTAQELKNSILQYAVQGKLVPQDPNDEPASELIKRIKAEKEQLITQKKVKKIRPLLPIADYEKPFEIPESWEWVRLYDISIIQEGAGIRSFQYKNSGIQLLTVTNILEGSVDLEKSKKYVSIEEYELKYSHLKLNIGDIVSSCSGASWGKTAIYNDSKTVMLNTSTLRLRFYNDSAYNEYLYYVTKSPLFKQQLMNQLSGMQPNFGFAHYSTILIPIPPLAEQQRIVEKIEELMSLVEEYGRAETELTELNKAFPEKIKKSVLQYAIQGKLVPQNPQNEPASVLLEKIKAEKQKLIKDKKIKADKPLPAITEEEIPFEIPDSWVWVRLGEICNFGSNESVLSSNISDNSWIIELEDIEKETGRIINFLSKRDRTSVSNKNVFKAGNVLYSKLRPYLNKVVVVEKNGFCSSEIFPLDFGSFIFNKYAQLFLMCPFFVDYATKKSYGTKMPRFGSKDGQNTLFPLPPLSEQKLIVEKVEEVLSYCDKLK